MLAKVLKKYIINIILEAAEGYKLFFLKLNGSKI